MFFVTAHKNLSTNKIIYAILSQDGGTYGTV